VRFYDPLGNPLAVAVGSPVAGLTQASQFPLALLANQSLTFGTTGESQPVLSGYAVINSTEPLQVTAHFRTLLGARILTEVSAGSSAPRYTAKGSIERYGGWEDNLPGGQQTTHINTGLAIVNLSDQAARIRISVTDQPAPANFQAVIFQLVLPAHGQYARFISEIFTALAAQFQGVVSISSDQPLGVTLIRTGDGIPLSMLPLGSLEEE